MKFDVSTIKVLDDAIALVQQRPEMFVGVGEVQPEFLATSLAHDALALGVRQVAEKIKATLEKVGATVELKCS